MASFQKARRAYVRKNPNEPTTRQKHALDPAMILKRFVRFVRIDKQTGCWNWGGSLVMSDGIKYGRFGMMRPDGQKTTNYAHRAAWEIFRGKIADGLYVCHKCDNGRCCNPFHLFLGTAEENMQDAARKGRLRQPVNIRNPAAVLTDEMIREIRASPLNAMDLHRSGKYPVCYQSIASVKNGSTFKDVS